MPQTSNYKIYYPSQDDTALAQTQMSMLANSTDAAIAGVATSQGRTLQNVSDRLASVEVIGGLQAGSPNDGTTSNNILNDKTRTRKALDGLYGSKSDVDTVSSAQKVDAQAIAAWQADSHYNLRQDVAKWVQHQLETGIGFVVLGSSTAEGYGSVTFGQPYDGESWVERMSSATTDKDLIKDNSADGTLGKQSKPATGIQWWNLARGGTTSADYLPDNKVATIGTIKPELVFHAVGSNNYGLQWGLGKNGYTEQMNAAIDKINKVSPDTQHILVSYQTANNKTNPPIKWWQYNEVLKKIASERTNVHYFDLSIDTYAMGMPGANQWWYYQSDNNHVKGVTHRHYANRMLDMMGLPHPPEAPEVFPWSGLQGGRDMNAGTTLGTIALGKRAWPRRVITQGNYFAQTRNGAQTTSLKLVDNTGAQSISRIDYNNNPTNVPMQLTSFIPAGVVGTVTLSIDGPNTTIYGTGSKDWYDVTSIAYVA